MRFQQKVPITSQIVHRDDTVMLTTDLVNGSNTAFIGSLAMSSAIFSVAEALYCGGGG